MDRIATGNTPNEGRLIINNLMTGVEQNAQLFVSPAYTGLASPFFTTISAAIASLGTSAPVGVRKNATIHVAAGLYSEGVTLSGTLSTGVTLIGHGRANAGIASPNMLGYTGTIVMFTGSQKLYINSMATCAIRGITFMRAENDWNADVVEVDNSSTVEFTDCEFIGTGVNSHTIVGLKCSNTDKITVTNCRAHSVYTGIQFVKCSNVLVNGIHGMDNYFAVVLVRAQDGFDDGNIVIKGVTSFGNNATSNNGIRLQAFSSGSILRNVVISDVVISNANASGVDLFVAAATAKIQDVSISNMVIRAAKTNAIWIETGAYVSNVNITNVIADGCTGVTVKNDGCQSLLVNNVQTLGTTDYAKEASGPVIIGRGPNFIDFVVSRDFAQGYTFGVGEDAIFKLNLPSDGGSPSYNKGNGSMAVFIEGLIGNTMEYNSVSQGAIAFKQMWSASARTTTGPTADLSFSLVQEHAETNCTATDGGSPQTLDQFNAFLEMDVSGSTAIAYRINSVVMTGASQKCSVLLKVRVLFYGFREAPLVTT